MRKLIVMAAIAIAALSSCSVFAAVPKTSDKSCSMAGHILIGAANSSMDEKEFLRALTEGDLGEMGFEIDQAKWIRRAIAQGVLAKEPVPLAVKLYESCMLSEV